MIMIAEEKKVAVANISGAYPTAPASGVGDEVL